MDTANFLWEMLFVLHLHYLKKQNKENREHPLQGKNRAFNSKFIFMLKSLKSDFFLCEIPVGSDVGKSLHDKSSPFYPSMLFWNFLLQENSF